MTAVYAQKLKYAAGGAHTYVALVALAHTLEEEPFEWIVYQYCASVASSLGYYMQAFQNEEEAQRGFPYGKGGYGADDT